MKKIEKFQFFYILDMIKAILIFNNQGKPRMTKFYQRYSESEQQAMIEVRFFWLDIKKIFN